MSLSDVACLPFTIISILIAVSVLNLKTRFDTHTRAGTDFFILPLVRDTANHTMAIHGQPFGNTAVFPRFCSRLLWPGNGRGK